MFFFLQKNKSQTVFTKNKGHKVRNILSKVFGRWVGNDENTGFVSWLLGITWHCCCLRRTFKIENDSAHEMSEGTKEIVPWKIFLSFLKWYSQIKLFWSISMAKFGGFNFQKSLWSDPEWFAVNLQLTLLEAGFAQWNQFVLTSFQI